MWEFTFDWYRKLIENIKDNYEIKDWKDAKDGVIIRHDVDYDLKKAYDFSCLENELGVKSTYFVLLTGDFYNVFSVYGRRYIKGIVDCGHKIGLHFDETIYEDDEGEEYFKERILQESAVLSDLIGNEVTTVSMHRPSKRMLEWNLDIPNIVNTYSRLYFNDYKYVSDSRRRWREDVIDVIRSKDFKNIQLLVHPFWYGNIEQKIEETVLEFVNRANIERYDYLDNNITNLCDILKRDEVRT